MGFLLSKTFSFATTDDDAASIFEAWPEVFEVFLTQGWWDWILHSCCEDKLLYHQLENILFNDKEASQRLVFHLSYFNHNYSPRIFRPIQVRRMPSSLRHSFSRTRQPDTKLERITAAPLEIFLLFLSRRHKKLLLLILSDSAELFEVAV